MKSRALLEMKVHRDCILFITFFYKIDITVMRCPNSWVKLLLQIFCKYVF